MTTKLLFKAALVVLVLFSFVVSFQFYWIEHTREIIRTEVCARTALTDSAVIGSIKARDALLRTLPSFGPLTHREYVKQLARDEALIRELSKPPDYC